MAPMIRFCFSTAMIVRRSSLSVKAWVSCGGLTGDPFSRSSRRTSESKPACDVTLRLTRLTCNCSADTIRHRPGTSSCT